MINYEVLKSQFLLNPEYTFLNHGSFGACPKPIFIDYQFWQLQLEREPVQFFVHTGNEVMQQSKQALAAFLNCDFDDLIFTMNPSYAMNIIIKSFEMQSGDEILSTNLEYGAMDRTWKYYCDKVGAKYKQQKITLPITSKEQVIDDFFQGYTDKTKAIFISQITSATGLILPVKEICARAKELGLITIVDGAHVPAHIDLDLQQLEADIYTGALHKWMLTPKGCSFLYVKKHLQNNFDPLLISWGYDADVPGKSKFLDYHQLQGTRDYSAFLTVPAALKFLIDNQWPKVSDRCRELVRANNEEIAEILGSTLLVPNTDEFLGQMCSIPIRTDDPMTLKAELFHKHKIEIPVVVTKDQTYIRYSIQAYNDQRDLNRLKEVLHQLKGGLII